MTWYTVRCDQQRPLTTVQRLKLGLLGRRALILELVSWSKWKQRGSCAGINKMKGLVKQQEEEWREKEEIIEKESVPCVRS